jgi:hypothetical protein
MHAFDYPTLKPAGIRIHAGALTQPPCADGDAAVIEDVSARTLLDALYFPWDTSERMMPALRGRLFRDACVE